MSNPLLAASTLPYQLPDFSRITNAHYAEALEAGLTAFQAEVDAIAHQDAEPTFANTVVAFIDAGKDFERAAVVFFNKISADSDDELKALEAEFMPKISALFTSLYLNEALFARIDALFDARETLGLDAEDRWVLEQCHRKFTLNGISVQGDDRERLKELNVALSEATTEFSTKLLAETNDLAVVFDDPSELDGFSAEQIQGCADAAEQRGLTGKYLVTLVLPTDQPALEVLTNRESRRRIHEAATSRGSRGNEWDTRELIVKIARLRAERARILGYDDHASAACAEESAGTTTAVKELLYPLAVPAARNVCREADILQTIINEEAAAAGTEPFALKAWDWQYYTAKRRDREFAFDASEIRPYLELNRVLRDGVFYAAHELFGLNFTEREDLVGYHPDVRVFEVIDDAGKGVGLFLFDAYTRDSKRGGAWMNNLVDQSTYRGTLPVICNNLNVPKPPEGAPTLLTLDEVGTLFHEFGHALHGFLSNVRYSRFSGTDVARDFVEFPSQVNEMWSTWPKVLTNYARHYETGEALPDELAAKLTGQGTFNMGFETFSILAAALLDQEWHKITPDAEIASVEQFESATLCRLGLQSDVVPPRYSSAYFSHTFGGGYDAKYYGYLWSEVLDADTVDWFTRNGGLTRANGARLADSVLSRGNSRDPLEGFREFMGRDPEVGPLLARRGLN